MKYTLLLTALLFGRSLIAAQPADIGHFKGLAFSSATDRHPLEIFGGSLTKCADDSASQTSITRCEVENGSLVVTGSEGNSLNVKLASVAVLENKGETGDRDYYFDGTTDLMIGAQSVTADVQVTLVLDETAPTRVRGFIDLPDQSAKTSFEAYLVQ